MVAPNVPVNEAERLLALHRLNLLGTPAEERFDRITRIAARLLDVPIALVSLISAKEQWFKSSQGLPAAATGRDISFCGHAVFNEKTLVVEDALADARFADNPLVLGDPNIRFYAGEPVRWAGQFVGTLCVIDSKPRAFSGADQQLLKDLAALVEAEFERGELSEAQAALVAEHDELSRRASIDGLTRMWNRGAILELLNKEIARAARGAALTVAAIDVDHFKAVNDTYGHPAGDHVLAEVASRLRGAIRESDSVGRWGGEEFLAVLGDCGADSADATVARILRGVSEEPIVFSAGLVPVTVSVGYASYGPMFQDAGSLLAAADGALYQAKAAGRNRSARARIQLSAAS
jgi:diguanylate cyclase (GGDEF)-like protein